MIVWRTAFPADRAPSGSQWGWKVQTKPEEAVWQLILLVRGGHLFCPLMSKQTPHTIRRPSFLRCNVHPIVWLRLVSPGSLRWLLNITLPVLVKKKELINYIWTNICLLTSREGPISSILFTYSNLVSYRSAGYLEMRLNLDKFNHCQSPLHILNHS